MSTNTIKLPSGDKMPTVGLGTWKGTEERVSPAQSKPVGEVVRAVKHAIVSGYRHIDGAALYQNEDEVGEGIRQGIKEAGITRKDLFVVSKLWMNSLHPDAVEPTCRKTLAGLGMDYLDLYLIHWPHAYKTSSDIFPRDANGEAMYDYTISPTDTWKAMEKLVEKGLVRNIGVSNFNRDQINDILAKGKIKPATNQVECHPYFNQERLSAFCKSKGIVITAYSPLGSPDRPWAKPGDPTLLEEPKLVEIAKRHNKTVAQVVLKWQLQRGLAVIPKSVTPSRIEQNFDLFNFELTKEEIEVIMDLDKGKEGRLFFPEQFGETKAKLHPYYPFNADF